MTRPSTLISCALAGLLITTGCASDGRELADPPLGATTSTRPTETTIPPDSAAVVPTDSVPPPTEPAALDGLTGLTVRSESFRAGDPIPPRHTCEGSGVSPSIQIGTIPPETTELALIVEELTNPFVHWVVWGIDPAAAAVPEAVPLADLPSGLNSLGQEGWAPPCPSDPGLHTFRFTIHALSEPLNLEAGADPNTTIGAIDAATIDQASVTATITVN